MNPSVAHGFPWGRSMSCQHQQNLTEALFSFLSCDLCRIMWLHAVSSTLLTSLQQRPLISQNSTKLKSLKIPVNHSLLCPRFGKCILVERFQCWSTQPINLQCYKKFSVSAIYQFNHSFLSKEEDLSSFLWMIHAAERKKREHRFPANKPFKHWVCTF